MKNLFWLAVAGTMALGLAASAWAADNAPARPAARPERPAVRPAAMLEGLNLTDDQKTQVKAILEQAHADAQAAATPEAKRDIMKAAMEKIKTTVLTDDQRAKLPQAAAGENREAAFQGLDLTDAQKASIKEIIQKARTDAQAATTPEAKRDILKAAMEKVQKDVLTDTQRTKLKERRAQGEKNPILERLHAALSQLNLTDDQKAQIKTILEGARAEIQSATTPQAKREALRGIMDKIKAVLTEDQKQKLEQAREQRTGAGAAPKRPAAAPQK